MNKITATAPGKCILFGEHAVVYGYTAIVSTIEINSTCSIQMTRKSQIRWNFPNFGNKFEISIENLVNDPEYLSKISNNPFFQFYFLLNQIISDFNLNPKGMEITVSSNLWSNSGLGSSASTACAYVKALDEFFLLNLSQEQLNRFAYSMEKFVHGNPSGIDNTVITQGGLLKYKGPNFSQITGIPRIPLLIIDSGISHSTAEAVNKVRKFKEKSPEIVGEIFQKIEEISNQGISALKKGNIDELGNLFRRNQTLLEKLDLSNPTIGKIIEIGKELGIYGVKITGAGMGGALIAVDSEEKLQKFQKRLKIDRFRTLLTYIGK